MSRNARYVDVSERVILSLRGHDSLDLIQRLSTNDIAKLPAHSAEQTVFTNEKGRIIEVATVLHRQENEVLIFGQGGDRNMMKEWIDKFIIMEDIETKDVTADMLHFILFDQEDIPRSHQVQAGSSEVLFFKEILGGEVLEHIVAPKSIGQFLSESLTTAGIELSSRSSYDAFRMLRGIPGFPSELSPLYNPLEAGLATLVSFTKGCYVGQEVIARLDTYRKVQKHLMRLDFDELPPDPPATIFLEGREWGTITSAAKLNDLGCKGLGYVKAGSESILDRLCFRRGKSEIRVRVEQPAT